jgi:hypothetical protein
MKNQKARFMRALLFVDAVGIEPTTVPSRQERDGTL